MRLQEIRNLVDSTADAAFAVDGHAVIVAWNRAAENFFGLSYKEVEGRLCGSIIQGINECGEVCSHDCTIQQAIRNHHPVSNFDLQVQTPGGKVWCNVSVLVAGEPDSISPYSIHIVRQVDVSKKLEILVRDFVVKETGLAAEQASKVIFSSRAPAREAELTKREVEILSLLSAGATTAKIASQLHISRATVNNHIQHLLRKLDAHTRLEAVRRAEHAGLI